MAGIGDSPTVRLWDSLRGQPAQTLTGAAGMIHAVAFSPDSRLLATGSSEGAVCLWETTAGACKRTLTHPGGPVYALAFTPDGSRLVIGGQAQSDGDISLRDTRTGSVVQTWPAHESRVTALAFSPDGKTLASGGGNGDGTIRLWDAGDWTLRQTLSGHTMTVQSVAFVPGGRLLMSAGSEGLIRLWDATSGRLISELCPEKPAASKTMTIHLMKWSTRYRNLKIPHLLAPQGFHILSRFKFTGNTLTGRQSS